MDEHVEMLIILDPDFPLDDVETIGNALSSSGALIPGFVPPEIGLLNIAGIRYAQEVDGVDFVLLPDRNIVSRWAKIARDGYPIAPDIPTRLAANVMAFSQAMNFIIEPSIAFHEVAPHQGNEVALEELAYFRAADQAQPIGWIDLALGRRRSLEITSPIFNETRDLSQPLRRWSMNYVAALKIAELELHEITAYDKAVALLDWMISDFIMAGPAAVFAMMYFSPRANKAGLIKRLRFMDRNRALLGIKNAAWDITHLSDFVCRIPGSEAEHKQYIFATGDEQLAILASLLIPDFEDTGLGKKMHHALASWWPREDAVRLADVLLSRFETASQRPPPSGPANQRDPVGEMMRMGEDIVFSWSPPRR